VCVAAFHVACVYVAFRAGSSVLPPVLMAGCAAMQAFPRCVVLGLTVEGSNIQALFAAWCVCDGVTITRWSQKSNSGIHVTLSST
jgi:hypothetical protein